MLHVLVAAFAAVGSALGAGPVIQEAKCRSAAVMRRGTELDAAYRVKRSRRGRLADRNDDRAVERSITIGADDLAAVPRAERLVDHHVDRVLDELHAPIAKREVRPTRVVAAGVNEAGPFRGALQAAA